MSLFEEQTSRNRLAPRQDAAPTRNRTNRTNSTFAGSGKPLIPAMRSAPASSLLEPPAPAPADVGTNWKRGYTRTSVVIDLFAALGATALAVAVRFGGAAPDGYLLGSLALPPLWVALVAMHRAYEHRFIGVGAEDFSRVLRAGIALMAVVAFASYATKAELARGYVILAIPGVVMLGLLGRCAQRSWLHRQRRHGRCVQRAVLVGTADDIRCTTHRLRRDSSHGVVVVGACVPDGSVRDVAELGVPVGASLEDIERIVRITDSDLITVLSSALLGGNELRRLAWRLEPTGAELAVCPGLAEIAGPRITVRPTAHSPMLQVARARLSGPSRLVKDIADRTAAVLGLSLLLPVLLAIGGLLWAQDRGNPLFTQKRVGRNGREFTIYKFRTMVANADSLKATLADYDGNSALLFKMVKDPRVTPLGQMLRRYSLDELPQLINVVRGEMSLVGPRPQVAQEVAEYNSDYRRRLLVKPGLTGLWQVSGRSDLSPAESEMLDLRYVENWSLGLDLQILWRTLRAVAGGSGAY